ncbi:MAG: hypothetical protein K0Q43_193 [Ramlibacter sp.]|jgi:hypothetical protein|nr:hypothetical protein [Ramlibacter sp.]
MDEILDWAWRVNKQPMVVRWVVWTLAVLLAISGFVGGGWLQWQLVSWLWSYGLQGLAAAVGLLFLIGPAWGMAIGFTLVAVPFDMLTE